jgi:hypothetical protein
VKTFGQGCVSISLLFASWTIVANA